MELLRVLGILLGIYGAFCLYLYLAQDSHIFFPTQTTDEQWQQVIEELNADYVTIRADDGMHLEGMFLADGSQEPRPTVLYFGGNADHAEHLAYALDPLRQANINILIMDYRGYGLSEGKPGTDLMKRDAEKIYDAAVSHPYVQSNSIIVWGHSLGAGIAAHVASVKPVSKVILFAPFTSITAMAQEQYPFVPISLLLKHKLDVLRLAPQLSHPALIMVGAKDTIIPPGHSRTIAEVWKGDVELIEVEGRGHNDLLDDRMVWEKVVEFVQVGAK